MNTFPGFDADILDSRSEVDGTFLPPLPSHRGYGFGRDLVEVEELKDSTRETLWSALSAETVRAYRQAWTGWVSYAEDNCVAVLPASPGSLMNYLQELVEEGRSLSAVRLVVSALSKAHRAAGMHSPVESETLKLYLHGLKRRYGRRAKQARPLDERAIAAIEATAKMPRRGRGGKMETAEYALRRGLMDIAIVRLLSDAGLRRSEAVALSWGDIAFEERGGIVSVARSKTDKAGEGATVWVTLETCEVLHSIKPDDVRPGDPVFVSEQRSRGGKDAKYRMSASQLSRRVSNAAKAAGLGEGYSGHSGRVGMVARTTRRGAPTDAIMHQGRWVSPQMVAVYGRNESGARILQYL